MVEIIGSAKEDQKMAGDLNQKVEEWLRWDKNPKTRDEIKKLADQNQTKDLEKILMKRVAFGTAGLRGKMAAGYACMNDLVIIQTAQGFLKYLEQNRAAALKAEGLVIGYDGRHNSKRWAQLTTTIFVTAGYKVRLFGDYAITPFIPFSVKKYGCASGVMVTASHNPKDDNGYKVYDCNGAQIVPPCDRMIQNSIMENLEPKDSSWKVEILQNHPLVIDPMKDALDSYLKTVIQDMIHPDYIECNKKVGLTFTYTPLHGTGYMPVEKVVQVVGIKIATVPEQKEPDPDFPTVKFPNPEEGKSSLDLSFKHAALNNSSVILANDPDADRFAVAEKNNKTGEWKIFTGNELGALFGYWTFQTYKKFKPNAPVNKVYMIASTVSSMILKTMAKREGFNFVDTLTGFKWIGNKALQLEKEGFDVILCFEEAIGFMCNSKVTDKDGVSALALFSCLVSQLYGNGQQIVDKLTEIYDYYGFHMSNNSYYFCHEPPKITAIFKRIRNFGGKDKYPSGILNNKYKIVSIRDLTTGYDNSQPGNRAILPVSCQSEMITFVFDNGLFITLRTSGTEPKVKYYSELCMSPDVKDKAVVESTLNEMVAAICQEFFEPDKNGLIPQTR
ncbi:glucose 1,6-bisphosphate synthase-like isoform X1 [Sitophilus oryzae]|uniref:Glucose 1,6-bisphosphate synthase-like isoform X1 n=2 Tax=Sitophilus oryzae TaxID=7048 RepID=A0A6J2YYY9_SITOR|nr:glucose 1,6-bisphosphate synthase-like isoform X1 [Sitophilus oryzae]